METTATVTRRAYAIFIDNPATGNPSLTFEEEKLIEVDGELVHHPIGSKRVEFDLEDEQAVELYNLIKNYYNDKVLNPPVVEVIEEEVVEVIEEEVEENG